MTFRSVSGREPSMAFDQDEQDDPSGGSGSVFSRRSFLKTVGGTSLAAGVLSPTLGEAQTGPAAVGPGDVPIELTINGTVKKLSVEPRVTLLDENPKPTPEQAKAGLAGNICRCGTYTRVLEAVLATKGVARG